MYQFKKISGFSFCQFKKQLLINDQYYWIGVFLQDSRESSIVDFLCFSIAKIRKIKKDAQKVCSKTIFFMRKSKKVTPI